MATISEDDVLKVARLSRLRIDAGNLKRYQKELGRIIAYVEQLNEVPTDDVSPTAQVTGLTNVMRADEPSEYHVSPDELLANVPDKEGRYIKVRRVL